MLYNPVGKTVLRCDASENAAAAILEQIQPDMTDKPVMFLSKKFNDCERKFSVGEREALAIYWAVQKCRYFLVGKKFVIETD